jgi:hypothetical protein
MLSTMDKTLKSLVAPDQQPIGRVADKRRSPPVSALPSLATRETADANYRTRTPVTENTKTMNATASIWTIEAILARRPNVTEFTPTQPELSAANCFIA